MREPPLDLADETLRACLRAEYGLAATEIAFRPLGHDSSAWVYRVRTADDATYFLKARLSVTNEAGLLVPRALHDHGIARVVAPLPTAARALWARAGGYALILYPFVAGTTGMALGMTDQQWRDYGALLAQIHATPVAPALARIMRREAFVPEWAAMVGRLDAHIGTQRFADPAAQALATCWRAHRDEIRTILDRAEDLGRRLARAAPPFVLCHADIHTGNVLLDTAGQVWIVDWDETILAPRERDLMFAVGGGISARLVGPREERCFVAGYGAGYGATAIDPLALAYYRATWAVGDIGSYGEQVYFRPDFGPATKQAGADALIGLFAPGEIVSLALASGDDGG